MVTELFYMRVGTLRLRRRWIDPDAVLRGQVFLTALSAVMLLLGGFALGWVAARWTAAPAAGRLGYHGYVNEASVTTSSWVENIAFASVRDGGGCACGGSHDNMTPALGNTSWMY